VFWLLISDESELSACTIWWWPPQLNLRVFPMVSFLINFIIYSSSVCVCAKEAVVSSQNCLCFYLVLYAASYNHSIKTIEQKLIIRIKPVVISRQSLWSKHGLAQNLWIQKYLRLCYANTIAKSLSLMNLSRHAMNHRPIQCNSSKWKVGRIEENQERVSSQWSTSNSRAFCR
jgi:hypothetical protein